MNKIFKEEVIKSQYDTEKEKCLNGCLQKMMININIKNLYPKCKKIQDKIVK